LLESGGFVRTLDGTTEEEDGMMRKNLPVTLALLAIVGAACSTVKQPPPVAAPATGTKVAEIVGMSFESGKASLTDSGRAQIKQAVRTLQEHPNLRVAVEGHTDADGSKTFNQSLSERRARAVGKQLVAHGISADRVTTRGFGETRPIADNASVEGRSRNRRVEIVVQGTGDSKSTSGSSN
jgi:outer membrane protein OmpA-like peptidoglycan-associated protein